MSNEINILENLVGELDFLLQEGVIMDIEEQAKFIKLFERGLDLIAEFTTTNKETTIINHSSK